ncbi:MAG: hypothetical protein AB1489_09795, partial [Acidobacteriota bacterium]
MLETLLHIGKTLRNAGRIKHHRYIKPAPLKNKKIKITYLSLPVRNDFHFDFNGIREIEDEDFIRHKLYYLMFKTSDADSLVKYIFGDIYYGLDKKENESGNYRMSNNEIKNIFGLSSYYRGQEDAKAFRGTVIEKFRASFEKELETIEDILKNSCQNQQVFLHFDFTGKNWYEFETEWNAINNKLLMEFLDEQEG